MLARVNPAIWISLSVIVLVALASSAFFMVLADTAQPEMATTPLTVASTITEVAEPTPSTTATTPTSLSSSPTPTTAITAAAPTFTKVSETTIDGGDLWLFPIDDNESQIALSTEQGGQIQMARLDPLQPTVKLQWKIVATSADTGGERIADHWHIYAHNAHWIAFSVTGADRSFLVKLDKDFNRLALTSVANKDTVSAEELASLGVATGDKKDPMAGQTRPVTTNDMFVVAEPNGVAVSHMVPGTGAKIFRFGTDGQATGTALVGGTTYNFNNGSSAELTQDGFTIFATESLNVVAQGAIKLLKTSLDWQPLSITTLLDEDRVNLSMGTSVTLPTGYRVFTARAVDGAYPRGEMPPPPKPGQGMADDSGAIVRYVFDANNQQIDRTVLHSSKGNRPHTALVGNKLITTWDTTGHVTLRVDEVN